MGILPNQRVRNQGRLEKCLAVASSAVSFHVKANRNGPRALWGDVCQNRNLRTIVKRGRETIEKREGNRDIETQFYRDINVKAFGAAVYNNKKIEVTSNQMVQQPMSIVYFIKKKRNTIQKQLKLSTGSSHCVAQISLFLFFSQVQIQMEVSQIFICPIYQ